MGRRCELPARWTVAWTSLPGPCRAVGSTVLSRTPSTGTPVAVVPVARPRPAAPHPTVSGRLTGSTEPGSCPGLYIDRSRERQRG
jgi:hypothetical protein